MEQFQEISPAFPDNNSSPAKQISSEEFQRLLYQWYEDKGLISNLRSHLRLLMINKLRNFEQKPANVTLSKQAFALLVAEYLLREGCHYTLSVFSTEVPVVANQLPSSLYEAHCNNKENEWRFDLESVKNLLELLGISHGENTKIRDLYCKNSDSLLSCLVNSKKLKTGVEISFNGNKSDFESFVKKVLDALGACPKIIEDFLETMRNYVSRENVKCCESLMKERNDVVSSLKHELVDKSKDIKLLTEQQNILKNDNKVLKNELRNVKKQANEAAIRENQLILKKQCLEEKLEEIRRLDTEIKDSLVKFENQACSEKCVKNIETINHLEKEVIKLQDSNKIKDLDIEKLHSKISDLYKDLKSSQERVEFLNSCLINFNKINLQQGEIVNIEEDSSDSVTDEILKEAHTKLHQLEKESDELELKFKQLNVK